MTTGDKVRENLLRRAASRRGYVLSKSRRRDPHAPDFGVWYLSRITTHGNERQIAVGSLDVIDEYLNGATS